MTLPAGPAWQPAEPQPARRLSTNLPDCVD